MQEAKTEFLTKFFNGLIQNKGTKAVKASEFLLSEAEKMMIRTGSSGSLSDYVNAALAEKLATDSVEVEKEDKSNS